MSLRSASGGSGNGGGALPHDMIRFTPDDTNLVAGSMSPLRLGEQSSPGGGGGDYGVVPSEHTQLGSLCRHRARRLGSDPSAWLDDGPYATYYCSCRRQPRPRPVKTTADDDDGPGRDVTPPDVAAAPLYGTSTLGVSRGPCGHARQHVVVCTSGVGAAEKIYQERCASSTSSSACKYSTFLGAEDSPQSRAIRNAVCVTVDGSGSHMVDRSINVAAAAAADDNLTSSSSAADHHLIGSAPVNL